MEIKMKKRFVREIHSDFNLRVKASSRWKSFVLPLNSDRVQEGKNEEKQREIENNTRG